MSLDEVKKRLSAGMRNCDISSELGVDPRYVASVKSRMKLYGDGGKGPKASDGDFGDFYNQIRMKEAERISKHKSCLRFKVVDGKAVQCGQPTKGNGTYCKSCKDEMVAKSYRQPLKWDEGFLDV